VPSAVRDSKRVGNLSIANGATQLPRPRLRGYEEPRGAYGGDDRVARRAGAADAHLPLVWLAHEERCFKRIRVAVRRMPKRGITSAAPAAPSRPINSTTERSRVRAVGTKPSETAE
jgi:hypothetical protein